MITLPPPATPRQLRLFGVALALLAAAASALLLARGRALAGGCALGAGGLTGLLALLRPALLRFVQRPLALGAALLGVVNATLLLTLVFFLWVTPVALLRRLRGHDPLCRRREPGATSYWEPRGPAGGAGSPEEALPDSFKRPF